MTIDGKGDAVTGWGTAAGRPASGGVGQTPLGPASGRARVVAVDALRGLALLGILLVNVQYIAGPQRLGPQAAWEGADRALFFLTTWLVEGKFISMFAFLFGVGIAIQADRARARGQSARAFLARRLAVLAAFGLAHGLLVWSGDILLTYAIAGFVLLAFLGSPPRTLRTWSIALWAVAGALLVLLALGAAAVERTGTSLADPAFARQAIEAYTSGNYATMVGRRVSELGVTLANLPLLLPWTLALMLAGMAAVRSGVVGSLADQRPLLRRTASLGLGIGLPLALAGALALSTDPSGNSGTAFLGYAVLLPAAPVLALGYLAIGAQVFTRRADAPLVRRLAATGRMALTNYLLQSVIGTAVFYGLGLYGQTPLWVAFGFWAVLSGLQLLWSPAWLARFDYGPMEWLWRRLTYGRSPTADPGATLGGE